MNPTLKAALIAVPVAILVQGVLILFALAQFGERVNFQLLSILGVGSGLLSFTWVKKHLQQHKS